MQHLIRNCTKQGCSSPMYKATFSTAMNYNGRRSSSCNSLTNNNKTFCTNLHKQKLYSWHKHSLFLTNITQHPFLSSPSILYQSVVPNKKMMRQSVYMGQSIEKKKRKCEHHVLFQVIVIIPYIYSSSIIENYLVIILKNIKSHIENLTK